VTEHKDRLKGLYAITDENLIPEKHFNQIVESALQGGVKIIQYRDKSNDQEKRLRQSSKLRLLCQKYKSLCIINDDIELAKEINADGVHLGKDDSSIAEARRVLGNDAIIGVSCYNDLSIAIDAERNSADYVAFGAVFRSPTKPNSAIAGLDIISKAKSRLSIPICVIGGITDTNIQQVVEHGSDMAAVISSLFSVDDTKDTASTFSSHFC
jgi:thiamine-phosphate pyrophosphorylase